MDAIKFYIKSACYQEAFLCVLNLITTSQGHFLRDADAAAASTARWAPRAEHRGRGREEARATSVSKNTPTAEPAARSQPIK